MSWKRVRELFKRYASDTMLIWFSFLWLFILLNVVGKAFYSLSEPNPFILYSEVALCAFGTIWGVFRVVSKLRSKKAI